MEDFPEECFCCGTTFDTEDEWLYHDCYCEVCCGDDNSYNELEEEY